MNLFIGWTESQLEAKLLQAQTDLADARAQVSLGTVDMNMTQQITQSTIETIRMLYVALNRLNPTEYPLDSISEISSTVATFS